MTIQATGFVPAKYRHPTLRPRRKGERYDQRVCDLWYIDSDGRTVRAVTFEPNKPDPKVGTAEKVGECTRQDPFTDQYFWADCFEVTMADGRVVPTTRLRAGEGDGDNYVLVHDVSWKMSR